MQEVKKMIQEKLGISTTTSTTLDSEEKNGKSSDPQKVKFDPPEILDEFECEGCKQPVKKTEMTIIGGEHKGKRQVFNIGCKCEDIEFSRQAIENRKKAIFSKMKTIFDEQSLIPKKLKNCSFDNFTPHNESQQNAFRTAFEYVQDFDPSESENLLFSGSYGIGKSHLCVSICKAVMEKGFSAIFISVPKLLTKIKSTYNKKDVTENDILTILEEVDLLVLDDIGAENDTEWTVSKLFEIVDNRQGKHTLYTTNMNSGELNTHIGDRNFSRVMFDTTPLKMEGSDMRIQHF